MACTRPGFQASPNPAALKSRLYILFFSTVSASLRNSFHKISRFFLLGRAGEGSHPHLPHNLWAESIASNVCQGEKILSGELLRNSATPWSFSLAQAPPPAGVKLLLLCSSQALGGVWRGQRGSEGARTSSLASHEALQGVTKLQELPSPCPSVGNWC